MSEPDSGDWYSDDFKPCRHQELAIKIPFKLNYKGLKSISDYGDDEKRVKADAKKFNDVVKFVMKNADKWYEKTFK